jgi:hypothetical protein
LPYRSEENLPLRWNTISEKTVSANQWFSLNLADVELPDGRHLDHYLLRQPPVAIAALLNDENQVLLLWRHRLDGSREVRQASRRRV